MEDITRYPDTVRFELARESYVLKKRPNGCYDLVPRERLNAWLEKHYPDRMKGMKLRFKRPERGSWIWDGEKLVERHLFQGRGRPSRLQIIKDIEPFQNIAVDGKTIGGRRQRRDMIRAHNLIEVGTEPPVNRKEHIPFNAREFAEDIKQGFRQHGVDVL